MVKFIFRSIQPAGYERAVRLWWDDTLPGFVRRLNWSPDGLLLACPAAELSPPPSAKDTAVKMEEDVVKAPIDLTTTAESKENVDPSGKQVHSKLFPMANKS